MDETIPTFASEREEREYWETHDAADVVDWATARGAVFPNLKASTETISLRLLRERGAAQDATDRT